MPSVGRAVSHPQNAYSAHLRGQYQQPHPVRKEMPLRYKSHLSYKPSFWLLPTKPPLSWFLQKGSSNLAHPMLCCNAASQGARPRSCGRTLCLSTTPPSAARRPASTSQSPWARVVFQHQLLCQLVITNDESTLVRKTRKRKTTHAQRGHTSLESQYF